MEEGLGTKLDYSSTVGVSELRAEVATTGHIMARKLREQLKLLEVEGVVETGKELGRGAYGVVLEMEVHGLR